MKLTWLKIQRITLQMTNLAKTAPVFDYPDWANWIAQEADGTWWCYEVEPLQYHKGWYENEVGRYLKVYKEKPSKNWEAHLIKIK